MMGTCDWSTATGAAFKSVPGSEKQALAAWLDSFHEACSEPNNASMCIWVERHMAWRLFWSQKSLNVHVCTRAPSSRLATADRYGAMWWTIVFLEFSALFFCHIPRSRIDWPRGKKTACKLFSTSRGPRESIACHSHSTPLKADVNRGGLLFECLSMPATLGKSHLTPNGACRRMPHHMQDYARKVMFCRGPQKCIAEKQRSTL